MYLQIVFCLGFDDLVDMMCSPEIQLILQDRGFKSMMVQAGKTKVEDFYFIYRSAATTI